MTNKLMQNKQKKHAGTKAVDATSMKTGNLSSNSSLSTVMSKGKKKKQKKKKAKVLKEKSDLVQKEVKDSHIKESALKLKGNPLDTIKNKSDHKSLTNKQQEKREHVEKDKTDKKSLGLSERKRLKKLLWKQKQMAKKLERKGLVNKHENKSLEKKVTKVVLPRNADEAAANWKKLQETMSNENSKKRKIPASRIRNPKYRKEEGGQIKNNVEDKPSEGPTEIWFDDVDEVLLDRKPVAMETMAAVDDNDKAKQDNPLVKQGAFKGVTKIVCMDCEMVGVGDGTDNMLARVSIVNQFGEPVYDKFVKPKEEVVDYRTFVSGVRPKDLEAGEEFEQVQKDVAEILRGKILVGHAVKNDLKVLFLSHPRKRIRDTSIYKPFRQLSGGRTPSLKKLSEKILAVKVQEGEHNSIQDAQATMRLYTMYRKQWEGEINKKRREKTGKKSKT